MSTATFSEQEQAVLDRVPTKLFIGGEWRDATGGGTLPVEDPSTGETIAEVADATVEDARRRAGRRRRRAGRTSPKTPPRERARDPAPRLRGARRAGRRPRAADDAGDGQGGRRVQGGDPLRRRLPALVRRRGRPHRRQLQGRRQGATAACIVMRQPVGPCLFITPWNFPMAMGTRKIGPAIAAGCTSVIKPAKQTPLSMLMLAQILEEAGLPGGALNVVTAKSSGKTMEPLIKDPRLRKLSFTGSTEVGRELMKSGSEQILRMSMELGGNAPFIVFEDADLDAAVDGAMLAKMRNVGEACTAANRFHVARGGRRRVREQARRAHGRAEGRPRLRGGRRGRPADRRHAARQGGRAGDRRRREGREGPRRRRGRRATAATSTSRRSSPTSPEAPSCCARRSSARSRRSRTFSDRGGGDRRGQRHGVRPGRLRLHPRPRSARSASRRRWRPGCSASTRASCPTPARRSAA